MNAIDVYIGLGLTIMIYLIQLGVYWYVTRFPPLEINRLYGYKTKRSMKNQVNWTYANALSNRLMLRAAHIYLVSAVLFLLFFHTLFSFAWYMGISTGLNILTITGYIAFTEYKLKQFEKTQP